MAQLSRPYQIALAALVVLAAVWFIMLRPHSSSSESSSARAPASTPSASSSASSSHSSSSPSAGNPGAPSSVYHGSAPGVEGLTKAVAKAHEAVAASQRNAKQLEERSAQASSGGASAGSAPATSAGSATAAAGSTAASGSKTSPGTGGSAAATGAPTNQARVEGELKQGKVVVLLFWNPKGADDVLVHRELQLLVRLHHNAAKAKTEEVRHADRFFGLELDKAIAVHEGPASAVASYGSVTRGVQVYSTPTLVIVNPHGHAATLTGFADAYTIEQAIEENRHA